MNLDAVRCRAESRMLKVDRLGAALPGLNFLRSTLSALLKKPPFGGGCF